MVKKTHVFKIYSERQRFYSLPQLVFPSDFLKPICFLGVFLKFFMILLLGEISITSDMQMTPPLWQKVKNYRAS